MNRFCARSVHPKGQLLSLVLAFSAFGVLFGTWQVLIDDLINALSLSEGQIGIAITSGLMGSIPTMFIANRALQYVGLRVVLFISGMVLVCMLASLGAISTYQALVVRLFLLFSAAGVYDMSINAAAIAFENNRSNRILVYLHALFSSMAMAAALTAGFLLRKSIAYTALFVYAAAIVGMFVFISTLLLGRLNPSRSLSKKSRDTHHKLWTSTMLLIVCVAALANLAQGAIENWSAVYLRTTLTFTALLGASGVAIFHASMSLGRLLTGLAIKYFGVSNVLVFVGGIISVGITLTLLNLNPFLTLGGILLMGISLAVVQPIAFTLAGTHAPNRANEASTIVTVTSYAGLIAGPVLIGGIAELTNLKIALSSIAVVGILIMLCGKGIKPRP